eukprot:scaffold20729_cov114-Isochrysis_galbana.AAC.1
MREKKVGAVSCRPSDPNSRRSSAAARSTTAAYGLSSDLVNGRRPVTLSAYQTSINLSSSDRAPDCRSRTVGPPEPPPRSMPWSAIARRALTSASLAKPSTTSQPHPSPCGVHRATAGGDPGPGAVVVPDTEAPPCFGCRRRRIEATAMQAAANPAKVSRWRRPPAGRDVREFRLGGAIGGIVLSLC